MRATLLHDLLDYRARRSPDKVGLRAAGASWTFRQIKQMSIAHADWLRRVGVQRGHRVLAMTPHSPETVALIFAVSRLGAINVIVASRTPPYLLESIVRDCEPTVALADDGSFGTTELVASAIPRAIISELPAVPHSPKLRVAPCVSIDPVSLIYTSGSTSTPKAVVSSHAQVLFAAEAIAGQLRYRSDDVVFSSLPMSFDYGLYQIYLCLIAGAELVLGTPEDTGPPLLSLLRDHNVSVLPVVPSLATSLRLAIARRGVPPERLRMITNTGAALSRYDAQQLSTLVPGLEVVRMFGLTECKRVSIMPASERNGRPESVGRPLPDTEVFVVDDGGRRLPPGVVGELVVRGHHVMSGYWRAPELTAAKFRRDEFGTLSLFTGDLCSIDEDGYLYYHGRRDEQYKQGEHRLSAAEVEAAALDIPGVDAAALLPPTEARGSVLAVMGESATSQSVRQGLLHRLGAVRVPDVCIVVESIPLQPSGKADKRALASAYDEQVRSTR